MAASNRSKPKLTAVAIPSFDNPQSLRDESPFVGVDAQDTMAICSNVLAFLAEFHIRTPDRQLDDEVEAGEHHILRALKESLDKQEKALDAANVRHAESAIAKEKQAQRVE